MNKISIPFLLSIAVLLSGCFSNKSNISNTDKNSLDIDNFPRVFNEVNFNLALNYPDSVEVLYISNTTDSIFDHLLSMKNINFLHLDYGQIKNVPSSIGLQKNMTRLVLKENSISTIENGIGKCAKLTILDLSTNKLHSLPDSLFFLPNLEHLVISNNGLIKIDKRFEQLKKLKWLFIENNNISSIDIDFHKLENLEKLYLSGNKLEGFPMELLMCKNLKQLKIDSKLLTDEILNKIKIELPNLRLIPPEGLRLEDL